MYLYEYIETITSDPVEFTNLTSGPKVVLFQAWNSYEERNNRFDIIT